MIEQGFNYADSTIKEMTDLCETRVEYLEPKQEKKRINQPKLAVQTRNTIYLHDECSHSTTSCKDLCAMVNKHK